MRDFSLFLIILLSITSIVLSNDCNSTSTGTEVIPKWKQWSFRFLQKNITLEECATEAPPVQVNITNGQFFLNGQLFTVKGIGYSPTPAGEQIQDWFQGKYYYLHERDLPLMRQMGVTVVRLWEWFYGLDHANFLNALWNDGVNPIYVLIPFTFTPEFYPDLTDPQIRQQCLVDWVAFISKYSKYPAVLGFLIGNELNTAYPNQLDWLFSLVNQMIAARNQVEASLAPYYHPITIPLANVGFQQIVERYNSYVNIDFWSVQVYQHDLQPVFEAYSEALQVTGKVRPILFTEFGADFLQDVTTTSPTTQQDILVNMWNQISNYQYSFGGCIMEWSDEWWKGNLPDFHHKNCPNLQPNIHAQCGIITSSTYVKEEWLGINRIWNQSEELSLCITPRPVFYKFASMWNETVAQNPYTAPPYYTPYLDGNWTGNFTTADPSQNANMYCAARPHLLYIPPIFTLVLPYFVFLLVMLCLFGCYTCFSNRRSNKKFQIVEQQCFNEDGSEELDAKFDDVVKRVRDLLEERLNTALYQFRLTREDCKAMGVCRCHCCLTKERLYRLIFDKALAAPVEVIHRISDGGGDIEKLLDDCTTMVWVRYLEGYHIWAGLSIPEITSASKSIPNKLTDLVLFNLISQSSMTLIHCPEKICELFHFFKSQQIESGEKFFISLQEIVKYYTDILAKKELHINYEDINHQAIIPRSSWGLVSYLRLYLDRLDRLPFSFLPKLPFLNKIYKAVPLPIYDAHLNDQDHSSSRRNFQSSPSIAQTEQTDATNNKKKKKKAEVVFKYYIRQELSRDYFKTQKPLRREYMNRSIVTFFYNYSWFIRLNIWLILAAWFFVPVNDACFKTLLYYLARIDCGWEILSSLLHIFVRFPWIGIIRHVLWLFAYSGIFAALFYISPCLPQDQANNIDILYLLLAILFTCVQELFLALFVRYPFPLPGRLRGTLISWKEFKRKLVLFLWNSGYYILVLVGTFVVDWLLLIPSVIDVTPKRLCTCTFVGIVDTTNEDYVCNDRTRFDCLVAIMLTWAAALLVCLVFFYMVWIVLFMTLGIFRALSLRIGHVKTWEGVTKKLDITRKKNVFHLTTARRRQAPNINLNMSINNQNQQIEADEFHIWETMIDEMYHEHLLSKSERKSLINNASFPPANQEAQRRVINFIDSLEGIAKASKLSQLSKNRRKYRVRCMPSWTVLVPIYNEAIFYSADDLRKKSNTKNDHNTSKRISELEYIIDIHPDEWINFVNYLFDSTEIALPCENPEVLLELFLDGNLSAEIEEEIRIWASLRGQTLSRTLKGLDNYRKALAAMCKWEGLNSENLASEKLQIVICHQTYHPDDVYATSADIDYQRRLKSDLELALRVCSEYDLVYDKDDKGLKEGYRSWMERFRRNPDPSKVQKFELNRPCPILTGEPKAENQIRGVAFVLNEVFQANDMNQFNSIENGFKVPFLFEEYFSTAESLYTNPKKIICYDSELIPKHRVVGFTEHTYTRPLSMVGELMGMAEFAFVSITQRVLNYPLRVRAHYGHPDFVDGYWVKNRGGPSKATKKVNTNEDIFLAYEMFCRGESVEYVEYIEQQKGRETAFSFASVFEAKLAQGAAQQLRSRELYFLNSSLPFFTRCSLFMGSIAFYAINLLMATTINFYLYGIVLFSISRISYHELGLLGAVIAVPWIIQVGFIQAFPLLIEFIITRGFRRGIVYWLLYLPFSLIFFVFHLRTKAFFFAKGLFLGSGGYKATGRGFGLDRVKLKEIFMIYSSSHFNEGLKLLAALAVYFLVTTDGVVTAIVRTASIILIVLSWLFAPVFFNPFPSVKDALLDLKLMNDWISSTVPLVRPGLQKEEPALQEILSKITSKKQEAVDIYNSIDVVKQRKEEEMDPKTMEALLSDFKVKWEEIYIKRRDKIANKWSLKSWQAWYWNEMIKEWQETKASTGKKIKWSMFKVVNFLWDFVPFILMAWELVTAAAFILIGLIVAFLCYFIATGMLIKNEYLRTSRLIVVIILPFVLYYYIYSNASFVSVIVSLMLFFMLLVALEIFIREILFPVNQSYFEVFTSKQLVSHKNEFDHHEKRYKQYDERKSLLDKKSSINEDYKVKQEKKSKSILQKIKDFIGFTVSPYFQTNTLLRILPYITMFLLGIVNLIISLFPTIMDTVLFNSRVSKRAAKIRIMVSAKAPINN